MSVSLEKAKAYLMAGLSVLPANKETKCQLGKWKMKEEGRISML